jgi:hypothetical protein
MSEKGKDASQLIFVALTFVLAIAIPASALYVFFTR